MYKQVETDQNVNGINSTIVATLADEYGGRVQVVNDDHCYVCYLLGNKDEKSYRPMSWIFPELFDVLKNLPTPN